MNWKETPVHVIDFEGCARTGIVEYGVVTLLGGKIVDTQTRLCHPESEIQALDVFHHGIQHEVAAQEAYFRDEWDYFSSLRKTGVLAAHYAIVEHNFIKRVWPYPPNSPSFLATNTLEANWGPWIDSCVLYKKIYPGLKEYKLGELVKCFDLQDQLDQWAKQYCPKTRQGYHCALYDALASALLLMRLDSLEGFEEMRLDWLVRMSNSEESAEKQMELEW